MPYLQRDGSRFHYHLDDYTEPWQAKSVVLLHHAAAGNLHRWRAWVPTLARHHRVIRHLDRHHRGIRRRDRRHRGRRNQECLHRANRNQDHRIPEFRRRVIHHRVIRRQGFPDRSRNRRSWPPEPRRKQTG